MDAPSEKSYPSPLSRVAVDDSAAVEVNASLNDDSEADTSCRKKQAEFSLTVPSQNHSHSIRRRTLNEPSFVGVELSNNSKFAEEVVKSLDFSDPYDSNILDKVSTDSDFVMNSDTVFKDKKGRGMSLPVYSSKPSALYSLSEASRQSCCWMNDSPAGRKLSQAQQNREMMSRRSSDSDVMILPHPIYKALSITRLSLHDAGVRFAWILSLRTPDLGLILSLSEGLCVFATPSCNNVLGVSCKELVQGNSPFTDRIHPKDLRLFQHITIDDVDGPTTIRFLRSEEDGKQSVVRLDVRIARLTGQRSLGEVVVAARPSSAKLRRDLTHMSLENLKRKSAVMNSPCPIAFSGNAESSDHSNSHDTEAHSVPEISVPTRPTLAHANSFTYSQRRSHRVAKSARLPSISLTKIFHEAIQQAKNPSSSSSNKSSRRTWSRDLLDVSQSTIAETPESFETAQNQSHETLNQPETGCETMLDPEVALKLPRGGYVVKTRYVGHVQFGLPPETIKDSLSLGSDVPVHFVVPKVLFDRDRGINTAEFEFPAYYNFFIGKKQVNLITTPEVAERCRTVFQETLLGPENYDNLSEEFLGEKSKKEAPDLEKESAYFARNPSDPEHSMNVDTILKFTFFDEKGEAVLWKNGDESVVVVDGGDNFALFEDGKEAIRCPTKISLPQIGDTRNVRPSDRVLQSSFAPPTFGVTFLGCSDGFDPEGTTTGFVLWVNRRGYMVDPPTNSGSILRLYGISHRHIDGVIVTHCHADHDAGTFHKILEGGRINVLTTPTIMNSFLRKYSAITGIDVQVLRSLFHFRSVRIGEPMNIHGAQVLFHYSLHSIPCIGFQVHFGGKSFIYSGDTMNDPPRLQKMYEEGILSEGRRDFLLNFEWNHSVILHEAGVPPIHTPMETLLKLSDDIKRRLYIVHCACCKVPNNQGLRIAKEGIEHSIIIPVEHPPYRGAMHILDLVSDVDVFSGFPMSKASEVLQISRVCNFSANSPIEVDGSTFFIIESGFVEQRRIDKERGPKYLTVGDYFGYTSLIEGSTKQVNKQFIALSECSCVAFSKYELLRVLEGTEVLARMKHMHSKPIPNFRQLLSMNSMFGSMVRDTAALLRRHVIRKHVSQHELVFVLEAPADFSVIIESGEMALTVDLASLDQEMLIANDLPSPGGIEARKQSKLHGHESILDMRSCSRDPSNSTVEILLGKGAFVGDVRALTNGGASLENGDTPEAANSVGLQQCFSGVMTEAGELLVIERAALVQLFYRYPGLGVALFDSLFRL